MKQTAVEYIIDKVKSTEWQDMFIWHKEEVFEQAKEMEKMAKKLIQDEWGKDDESLQFGIRVGFREGFEKHAELTADRRFTEDDIKQAYYQGRKDAVNSVTNKLDFINPDDYIKSISQPKSWEVEYK